jgi:hypothetical protein
MTLAYQRFTAVLLLIYGSLFLSGVFYCLSVFLYAVARMSELLLKLGRSGSEIRQMLDLAPNDFFCSRDKENIERMAFRRY